MGCELGWVDEQCQHGQGIGSERVPDWTGTMVARWSADVRIVSWDRLHTKIKVTLVQGAHRGDDADRLVFFKRSLTPCSEVR